MMNQQQQWIECARRLTELQRSSDCVRYCVETSLSGKKGKWLSIYGACSTGEIFVEVTDDRVTRVESFQSRHKNCPTEERRHDMTLVDTADAFALARKICRHWPRHRRTRQEMNYGPKPTSTHAPPTKPQTT